LGPQRTLHEVRFKVPAFARAGGIVQMHVEFPHAHPEPGGTRLLGIFIAGLMATLEMGITPAVA
jgi:hypothetical protein